MNPIPSPFTSDLEEIRLGCEKLWPLFQGKKIFISGGTGLFGRWLLESFRYMSDQYGLKVEIVVLSRNPESFYQKAPHFRTGLAQFITGDVTTFEFPQQHFDYVIHAATEASAALNDNEPLIMLDTTVNGTHRMLDFATQCGASKFLLTSSGAVYGRQPPELGNIPEDFGGGPDSCNPHWAYGEGKRLSELLCAIYHRQHGLECQIARCFALIAPYLPLDIHFAAGNFIGNTLRGEPIVIKGDGTPYRSYIYGTDLIVWLLTILLQGQPMRPYHIGSDHAISIRDLATLISKLGPEPVPIQILGTPQSGIPAERYVPSTERTRRELGLRMIVDLNEALNRTWKFLKTPPPS